jgi:hypothetical protein
MIGSSQVDLVCWTGRVCRDCREALTTVTLEEPAGSRNVQRSRGATGCRLFRDLRQLSGEPMPDPSMTAAAASHWQRYDFRCGSNSEVRPCNSAVRFTPKNRHHQPGLSGPKSARTGHVAAAYFVAVGCGACQLPTRQRLSGPSTIIWILEPSALSSRPPARCRDSLHSARTSGKRFKLPKLA